MWGPSLLALDPQLYHGAGQRAPCCDGQIVGDEQHGGPLPRAERLERVLRAERHHGAPLLVGVETLEQAARAEATEELVEHRERQEALVRV